ncbi:unnamed protein product [Urochloa humidicola]
MTPPTGKATTKTAAAICISKSAGKAFAQSIPHGTYTAQHSRNGSHGSPQGDAVIVPPPAAHRPTPAAQNHNARTAAVARGRRHRRLHTLATHCGHLVAACSSPLKRGNHCAPPPAPRLGPLHRPLHEEPREVGSGAPPWCHRSTSARSIPATSP